MRGGQAPPLDLTNTRHRSERLGPLSLYPKERTTPRPTTEQILRRYSRTQRSIISYNHSDIHTFEPELTALQEQVLNLLGVPASRYRTGAQRHNESP